MFAVFVYVCFKHVDIQTSKELIQMDTDKMMTLIAQINIASVKPFSFFYKS